MNNLVLSIFPGIDLLGKAFEEIGFCVVRGPDLLWGGDIRTFHPPAGVFGGVIGGPPCQMFSQLRYLNLLASQKHGNMIPEFERVVSEAKPQWFLMENVPAAPVPEVIGYKVHSIVYNNRWAGGVQQRERRFSFGTPEGQKLLPEEVIFETTEESLAVLAGHGPTPGKRRAVTMLASSGGALHPGNFNRPPLPIMCELQGLPSAFCDDMPFTTVGKRQVIGNGVPLPMGRAIAKAVRKAISP